MRISCLLAILLFAAVPLSAALTPAVTPTTPAITAVDLDREALETRLGRKLKLKERVALSLARGKMKRAEKRLARAEAGGPTDGFALTSFVLGLVSALLFLLSLPYFTGVLIASLLGPLALTFGIISLVRIGRDPQYRRGKGLGIVGIVLGGLGTLFLAFLLILVATAF